MWFTMQLFLSYHFAFSIFRKLCSAIVKPLIKTFSKHLHVKVVWLDRGWNCQLICNCSIIDLISFYLYFQIRLCNQHYLFVFKSNYFFRARMDLVLIPLKIELHALLLFSFSIKIWGKRYSYDRVWINQRLWFYQSEAITKNIFNINDAEPDKSPPAFGIYSEVSNVLYFVILLLQRNL